MSSCEEQKQLILIRDKNHHLITTQEFSFSILCFLTNIMDEIEYSIVTKCILQASSTAVTSRSL